MTVRTRDIDVKVILTPTGSIDKILATETFPSGRRWYAAVQLDEESLARNGIDVYLDELARALSRRDDRYRVGSPHLYYEAVHAKFEEARKNPVESFG